MPKPAFDSIALHYDATFTRTAVGRLQRAVVQTYLEMKINPGAAVLELNCGTGEDAVWLAQRGCRVLATDISPEMVAATVEKITKLNLGDRIQTQTLDIRVLSSDIQMIQYLDTRISGFDLVLSNFGGLNCLSPEDLRQFGAVLPGLLKPGGLFVAVVMGRFCWWESLYFLLKGRLRAAFRRLGGGPVAARLDARTTVSTWYYTPAAFRDFFPGLGVKSVQPVGFWLPPSYLDTWFARRPAWLRYLYFLEKKCRGRLWAQAADHFMIVFQM